MKADPDLKDGCRAYPCGSDFKKFEKNTFETILKCFFEKGLVVIDMITLIVFNISRIFNSCFFQNKLVFVVLLC